MQIKEERYKIEKAKRIDNKKRQKKEKTKKKRKIINTMTRKEKRWKAKK